MRTNGAGRVGVPNTARPNGAGQRRNRPRPNDAAPAAEAGFEVFINHLHIEDALDAATSVSELPMQTMAFALFLGEHL